MKASLIIKIVEAHSNGDEALFQKAVNDLCNDEEKKGNAALALSIRKASNNSKANTSKSNNNQSNLMNFSVQSLVASAPKDRDSTLDLFDIITSDIPMSQVALTDQHKEMFRQIIAEQEKAETLLMNGVLPSNRVLFCGPPGCGKTLTAKALAYELNLPIAYVRLDGLVSSYLGQTSTNIRKIFEFVKNKRIMLFLDEFDAIAKKRDDAHELGELKRVVTTLLQNFDSMPNNVFLVAATNHQHLLDPAIWRRFNYTIFMNIPTIDQRREMIVHNLNFYSLELDTEIDFLADLTECMNGSEIYEFLQFLARSRYLSGISANSLSREDIANAFFKQRTMASQNESEKYRILQDLNNKGMPMRTLEKISGIPKSTLSYQFRKEDKNNG